MKIRCVKKVVNTVATKRSCCIILINGFIDETQNYEINNKRSLDASEYQKKHCFNFYKLARTVSSYNSQEVFLKFK